jgi:hypothetical protein
VGEVVGSVDMLKIRFRSGIAVVRQVTRIWLHSIADCDGVLVHRFDYFLAVVKRLALPPYLKQMPSLDVKQPGFDGSRAT